MIESVIYFLLISKNNKGEHTCCHCLLWNTDSLGENQPVYLQLIFLSPLTFLVISSLTLTWTVCRRKELLKRLSLKYSQTPK